MSARWRRNVARTAGLALVAVSLVLLGGSGSASADGGATLKAQGWWSQVPAAVAAPNASKGQLVVEGNPKDKNGTAYSAVRYDAGEGNSVSTLTLKVGSNGDTGGSSAVVLACQTGSAWSPVDGGDYAAAPQVTAKCATGKRSQDGASWTFDLATLQTGSVVDVAIVPGMDPMTKTPSTFSLVFDPPSDSSLATAPASAGSSSTPVTSSASTPVTFASPSGATTGAPPGGAVHPPTAPTATPAIPSAKIGETATSPARQADNPAPVNSITPSTASSSKPNKTMGYIVLALAVLIGLYAYRQDNLMARNGGRLPGDKDQPGGLGRFTRPRTGQPPALTGPLWCAPG